MRLKHPDMRPNAAVEFTFDGQKMAALQGETIAAALGAAHVTSVRQARSGAPRGPFCGMGVCFDCLVTVNGRPSQRACLTKVEAGMEVRSMPPEPAAQRSEPPEPVQEIACDVLGAQCRSNSLALQRRHRLAIEREFDGSVRPHVRMLQAHDKRSTMT